MLLPQIWEYLIDRNSHFLCVFAHFSDNPQRSVIAAMPSLHELHNLHLSFLSIHDLEQLFKLFLSFLASCCHHLLPIELSFLQGVCRPISSNAIGILTIVPMIADSDIADTVILPRPIDVVYLFVRWNLTEESHID